MTFTLTLSGGFGGVGWYSYWGYSYDVTTGELLTLKTLTDNYSKFEETLISQVKQELEKLKSQFKIVLITTSLASSITSSLPLK